MNKFLLAQVILPTCFHHPHSAFWNIQLTTSRRVDVWTTVEFNFEFIFFQLDIGSLQLSGKVNVIKNENKNLHLI